MRTTKTLTINPEQIKIGKNLLRFRQDLGDISALAKSIKNVGQLQPIIIDTDYNLIVGERRLQACKELNQSVIVRIIDENNPASLREIEIEENIQRKNFTPAEEVLAVKELHELKINSVQSPESRSGSKTKQWTMKDTAMLLNKERSSISKDLELAKAIEALPGLKKCKTKKDLRTAIKAVEKILTRVENAQIYKEKIEAKKEQVTVNNISAEEFMKNLKTNSVDILLTDPPYGIDIDKNAIGINNITGNNFNLQGFSFDDSKNVIENFISTLAKESFRFTKPTAHAYVFCGFEFFQRIKQKFTEAGWQVYLKPIIWVKPGQGQSNNPDVWPVTSYECILYARKKDSVLIKAQSDHISAGRTLPSNKIHPTQKPIDLLSNLISRSVYKGATLVDPFMGSGSSLIAGYKHGCFVSGTDINKHAYNAAVEYIAKETK